MKSSNGRTWAKFFGARQILRPRPPLRCSFSALYLCLAALLDSDRMAKRERVDKVDDQGRHKMGFVKNKAPAPIQITAEQIMREALDQVAPPLKPPKQQITDPDELAEYR